MRPRISHVRVRPAAATTAVLLAMLAVDVATPPASSSVGSLQARLSRQRARAHTLAAGAGQASRLIAELDGQIALVTRREAAVQARLTAARAALAAAQGAVVRERELVATLVQRLTRARNALSNELVSEYESQPQSVVTVVLQAHGFTDLIERLHYLHMAQAQQKSIVDATTLAKERAQIAAARLSRLEGRDQSIAVEVATEARAIGGMNSLLQSKRLAAERVHAIQLAQLAATRSRQHQLSHELAVLEAQQAAAAPAGAGGPVPYGTAGSTGGWAIPYAIVLCESGGQNLTPNSAGASGYYQILSSTWAGAGGTGPAAYLAPKSEQDRIASILWNRGAGAANWVCAGIVGIH